ncbi:XRE family transcriptional regulator [Actinokineospora iranica]|uniref:Zn-dependent peptidase ImmA, M78 family n=1 Tax=Actinokineospora iranica TaxID=1271860 RepID=A0A1G6V923_9PSEU|nr:XRE family transcriptional regulator [Actinokineospora iranica]SDD50210.1 Zn-dependent peptidase ImmA, M78 family [Actinokineospora iranica]
MSDRLDDIASFFDGGRLTLARQLAGLRKNALAGLIGKTPTAVAAYESGSKNPAPATVAALALALQVAPGFFTARPSRRTLAATAPHFRSLRSTSQISRDQAHAYGCLALDVVTAIERHVEFPARDLPCRPVAPDAIGRGPEAAAAALRLAWDLPPGPVGHLVRLVENHGGVVVFSPLANATVDAYSFDTAQRPIILLNPLKDDYYRQRFDVAHELGHLVMHVDAEPGGRAVEDQAHRFAAEFLMPAAEIADELPAKADWSRLGQLKQHWNVSLQALLFRARTLKVMSDVTYRNAMATISARGWRRREPGPMPLLEQPSLLPRALKLLADEARVDEHTIAAECQAPLGLFRTIVSRSPSAQPVSADAAGRPVSLLALEE